jgi:tetratricopeptide (TPR) repeat protein
MNGLPGGRNRILATGFLFAAGCVAFQSPTLTGPQLVRQGKLAEALAVFRQDVEAEPKSVAANNGAGVVLDLMGRYPEARQYFTQAIKVASTPLDKVAALRAMAVAWGFVGDCKNAEQYDSAAYQLYLNGSDFYNAGEVADELGRLCIDAGDLNRALEWYERGHDTGLNEPNIPPGRRDLWNFRWNHAQARLAVRRGKIPEARKFVAAARTILDKGTNPDQQAYFPYLTGYVAFYSGEYTEALQDLQQATSTDPFIQCLIAQTYEKLGDRTHAQEYYRKAAGTTAHSVPAAYARPFATRKLE